MAVAEENLAIRHALLNLEDRIERMHRDFDKFIHDEIERMPDWEQLERDLITFSKKKIFDLELANQLDRILYKFQNRKRIWLRWLEERDGASK
ncbi:MAG: hypothetical protein DRG63_04670 [Deltaproteobacteria bacterium]|nr:MAG: hypothetical protein DRG63_04670 [Deltaproteobacteria bacterium]